MSPRLWRRRKAPRLLASPDVRAILVIAAAVVLANMLFISGLFDPNPLWALNGLGTVKTHGLLAGLDTIDPNNGITSQALGHRAVLDWLHLQIPWWNPYEATGAPLAAEMAGAAMFPFTIFTLFANGQLYEHILLELLAGGATYLLLRRLAVSRWAGTAAAIAFALNGTFAWFTHAPTNPTAFLPLVLLGLETAFSASMAGRRGGWWLIAVAAALSVYAGFPETAYIDSLLAILWFAWRCGCVDRPHLRAFVTKTALGAAVAALLAAPLLVSFADYFPHAVTTHSNGAFAHVHLPHAALPQLLLPYVYGPIFGFSDPAGTLTGIWSSVGGYLSTSLLFFGLLGLVSPGRRGLRLILLAWIVLALARIYGEPTGLRDVLGVLPDMANVAFLRYSDPTLELAVVVLAAFGIDATIRQSVPLRRILAVALVSGATVAAATIGAASLAQKLTSPDHRVYVWVSVIWAVSVLLACGLATVLRSYRARRLIVASVVALDALVLFAVPELSAPRNVTADHAPVAFLQRHLGLSRFATLGPLEANFGSYFGLRAVNVSDDIAPKAFARYVNKHLDPWVVPIIFVGTGAGRAPGTPSPEQELLSNLNGYRAAAVRYVLAPPGTELPSGPNPGGPSSGAHGRSAVAQGQVIYTGWAGDLRDREPAREVIATVNGKIVGRGTPELARPDVPAAGYPAGFLLAGFQLSVPAWANASKVRVFAIGRDGSVAQLPTKTVAARGGVAKIAGRTVALQPGTDVGGVDTETPVGGGFSIVLRSPTTWIYRLNGAASYFTATNPACTVEAQNGQSVRLSCSSPSTLIRRETYMPGWSATVDGHARQVREYDDAFQAVTVGPGTHVVTFAFTPPRTDWALLGFAVGCVCLLAAPLRVRTQTLQGRLKRLAQVR